MIIFFDISIVLVLIVVALLLICSILYSSITVYDWFIGHIGIILIIFAVKAVLHCICIWTNNEEFRDSEEFGDSRKINILLAIIANIVQLSSFWIFIHEMSVLRSEHPVITIICTIFAFGGFFNPLLLSLFAGIDLGTNVLSSIANIVCGILFIIACFVTSLGWKIAICLISSIIGQILGLATQGDA